MNDLPKPRSREIIIMHFPKYEPASYSKAEALNPILMTMLNPNA